MTTLRAQPPRTVSTTKTNRVCASSTEDEDYTIKEEQYTVCDELFAFKGGIAPDDDMFEVIKTE